MSQPRAVMLTFAPMIDSETARLLLRHYGIGYDERDHLFVWAALLTLFHGGSGKIPLVHGAGLRATGPYPLAQACDATLSEDKRLIPTLAPLAATVAADWATFNDGLGTATAVFAYFHLLPERALMQPIFAEPVPSFEQWVSSWTYPAFAWLLDKALRLTPDHAAQAGTKIRAVFDETDRRIADGRCYLCGDRLTLGDIALAASAAPLLLPEGYGAKMPPLAAMPAAMRELNGELCDRPTARFVDRLYREVFGTP